MNNIIALSGRMGSGKDTVADMIIRYLNHGLDKYEMTEIEAIQKYKSNGGDVSFIFGTRSTWEVCKFAAKLKTIASILTGIPVEKFEDQEFKNSELPKEWQIEPQNEGYAIDSRLLDDYPSIDDVIKMFKEQPIVCFNSNGNSMIVPIQKRKGLKTYRDFLQALGTEGLRQGLHPNTWLNALWCDYTEDSKWILSDMRFNNEMQSVKDRGGITLRLTRNSNVPATHPSETELDNAEFDYVIDKENQSLEETYEEVKKFCKHYELL